MKILALDMATKTGWAVNDPELSGVENFAVKRGESPGMRFIRFKSWLEEMIKRVEPDLVVHEQPHHRGGASTEVALGFVTHLQSTLAPHGIEYTNKHTSEIKIHATGKGNAGKPAMIKAYREKWGVDPADDNEADARWLLDLVRKEYGSECPT